MPTRTKHPTPVWARLHSRNVETEPRCLPSRERHTYKFIAVDFTSLARPFPGVVHHQSFPCLPKHLSSSSNHTPKDTNPGERFSPQPPWIPLKNWIWWPFIPGHPGRRFFLVLGLPCLPFESKTEPQFGSRDSRGHLSFPGFPLLSFLRFFLLALLFFLAVLPRQRTPEDIVCSDRVRPHFPGDKPFGE